MSLVPTIYDYADAGAPALTGQAGSLNALLRACLVTGYGSGSSAKPPAGWTEPFPSSGNVAVFRNSVIEGSGTHLRVDDSGAGAAGLRAAVVKSYKSMSELSTGIDVAPNPALFTGELQWIKSATLDGMSRPWWAIANSRALYLFTAEGLAAGEEKPYAALDLISHKPGDAYPFWLAGVTGYMSGTHGSGGTNGFYRTSATMDANDTLSNGAWLTRRHDAAAGAVRAQFNRDREAAGSSGQYGGLGQIAYPDPVSGGLLCGRLYVKEGAGIIRGRLPGLRIPYHNRPFADRALIEDATGLPAFRAKNFNLWSNTSAPMQMGQLLFDTGVDWL